MERGEILKESIYKSYDELPLFLNAEMVAKLLGVSPSSAYELMHEKGFPAMRVGNRLIVPKAEFQTWVQTQINKEGSEDLEIRTVSVPQRKAELLSSAQRDLLSGAVNR